MPLRHGLADADAGIVILTRQANEVLIEEDADELATFVRVVAKATREYGVAIDRGEWWDRPALPFHIVLQVSPGVLDDECSRWGMAGAEMTSLVSR